MRRLIFIHGINNEKFTPEQIGQSWAAALRGALGSLADSWWDDVRIDTAYYADVLHAHEQSWDGGMAAVVAMATSTLGADRAPDDLASLYVEMQRGLGITDAQVETHLPADQAGRLRPMAAGIHKDWLKAIARALEAIVPGAANGLAEKFLRQAATYLNKPGTFDEINSLVEAQVFSDIDPENTVVVSHSLGTIIAYVLLRQMSDAPKLPLFVTLGSPLGIRLVRDRIQMPYITPPIAARWLNGSDPEDFVALQTELNAATFGPVEITNISNLDNGHADAHAIEKYLAHPAIALAIGQALA